MPVKYSDHEILLTERSKLARTRGTVITAVVGVGVLLMGAIQFEIESLGPKGTRRLLVGIGILLVLLGLYGTYSILAENRVSLHFLADGYSILDGNSGEVKEEVKKGQISGYNIQSLILKGNPLAHVFHIIHKDESNLRIELNSYTGGIRNDRELVEALVKHFKEFYEVNEMKLDLLF